MRCSRSARSGRLRFFRLLGLVMTPISIGPGCLQEPGETRRVVSDEDHACRTPRLRKPLRGRWITEAAAGHDIIVPMRWVIAWCCACGGATVATEPAQTPKHVVREAPAIDPIATLQQDDLARSWLVPGPVQLELGAPPIQGSGGEPIEVAFIEERGSVVRVGVILDRARFAVWTDRARLY